MIQITLDTQEDRVIALTITGHALSDDLGRDLVCAGVSAIGTGLLNALDRLCPNDYELVLRDGENPLISVLEKNMNDVGKTVLQTSLIQLETIQESFPEYIQIVGGYEDEI